MPYACSAGDADPVVVHLQQLDGDFEVVDFCATHWVQFVASTAQTLGMFDALDGDQPGPVLDGPDPDSGDDRPVQDTGTSDPESGDESDGDTSEEDGHLRPEPASQ